MLDYRAGSVRPCQKVSLAMKDYLEGASAMQRNLDFILSAGQLRDVTWLAIYFRSMWRFTDPLQRSWTNAVIAKIDQWRRG